MDGRLFLSVLSNTYIYAYIQVNVSAVDLYRYAHHASETSDARACT